MKNYYDELEVSRNASPEIISKVYKVLAKKYHPDTTKENKQEAEERFKRISEAYETLSDEQKRAEYDNSLEPQISIEDYNKLLSDNKILANELSNLKSHIDELNTRQANYYNNVNQQASNNTINQNMNSNYNPNEQTVYNKRVYYRPQNNNSYSFIDLLKYKTKRFFKSVFAFFLTIIVMFVIICILLYIPSTRNFILNDLHFGIFLKLFK